MFSTNCAYRSGRAVLSTSILSKHYPLHTRRLASTVTGQTSNLPTTRTFTPAQGQSSTSLARERMRDRLRDRTRDQKPFSDFLTDTFHRQHDYLRISVTERCNLRCVYCMPEEGVPLSPNNELLTTPEIFMLSSIFVSQGVNKIRLTGGEPTVRRDILPLMHQIGTLRSHGLKEICLTTNGISLHRKLDSMVEAGLTGVNLSLDTLDPWQFQIMTRRKGFDAVQKSIDRILELNKLGACIKLKINCVVMRGINDREILPFVNLTREKDIEVRFIEYMPFDGNKWSQGKMVSYSEMLDAIRDEYPGLAKVQDHPNDTSKTWQVPSFVGKIGFITSMTHNFCGTCNRLRITGDGNLKVCLFGNAEVSLRDILRKSNNGQPIDEEAFQAMRLIELDRRKALALDEEVPRLAPNETELLEVISMAVKRKKAKHAGMGNLEHMKNRPMILIDSVQNPISSSLQSHVRHLIQAPSFPQHFNNPFSSSHHHHTHQRRLFSSSHHLWKAKDSDNDGDDNKNNPPRLTHVSESGAAHMVSISAKSITSRTATAACTVRFSNPQVIKLIGENSLKKGDVLGVARVAGIMAAKQTASLIPLCHPIPITQVSVELDPVEDEESGSGSGGGGCGEISVRATVKCDGKTGVEMEALTAASIAALTIYDMCKAVDKGIVVEGLRVVLKEGGKSGRWTME